MENLDEFEVLGFEKAFQGQTSLSLEGLESQTFNRSPAIGFSVSLPAVEEPTAHGGSDQGGRRR